MKYRLLGLLAASTAIGTALPASAAILWADLTGQPTASTVVGTVGGVGVTYTGNIQFAQTAGGTNYWTPFPSVNAPPASDIIATTLAGTKTITFSQSVNDVYLALNSWNGQSATFDHAFTVEAQGCGYWGCGTAIVSNGNTTIFGSGELHGILKFAGPITSLSYGDTLNENWHGIQIGIGSVEAVPEASTWAMMIAGFGMAGFAMRRRRKLHVSFA